MNASSIVPTENDVIFGRKGCNNKSADATPGNKRLWEIMKENSEAHRNADIENAVLEQVKKELPLSRFLRLVVPAHGSGENESYRWLTNDETQKEVNRAFNTVDRQNNHSNNERTIRKILRAQQRFSNLKAISKLQDSSFAQARHENSRQPSSTIVNKARATKEKRIITSAKRPNETVTTGSHKKARVSLRSGRILPSCKGRCQSEHPCSACGPPSDSAAEGRIVIEQEPAEFSKELATIKNQKRDLLTTVDSLQEKNNMLEQKNGNLERKIVELVRKIAALEDQIQQATSPAAGDESQDTGGESWLFDLSRHPSLNVVVDSTNMY